jgi:protein kinase
MAELFTQKPLFQGTSETDQFFKICGVVGAPSPTNWPDGVRLATRLGIRLPQTPPTPLASLLPNASPEAIDLLRQMLQLDPTKRPGAAQALQHPWFAGPATPPAAADPAPADAAARAGGHADAAQGEASPPRAAPAVRPPLFGEARRPVPLIARANSQAPEFDDIFDGID